MIDQTGPIRRRTDPLVAALLGTLRSTVGALPATPLATA